eukprot:6162666-Prymnesium_polylepis.2
MAHLTCPVLPLPTKLTKYATNARSTGRGAGAERLGGLLEQAAQMQAGEAVGGGGDDDDAEAVEVEEDGVARSRVVMLVHHEHAALQARAQYSHPEPSPSKPHPEAPASTITPRPHRAPKLRKPLDLSPSSRRLNPQAASCAVHPAVRATAQHVQVLSAGEPPY